MTKLRNMIPACLIVLVLSGCGNQTLSDDETAPFQKAILAYLQEKHMQMKVVEFQSLNLSGEKATGVVALQDADGLYAIKVKWEFTFEKSGDHWKALSHKAL